MQQQQAERLQQLRADHYIRQEQQADPYARNITSHCPKWNV
jgi:hypothetical protein